MALYTRAQYADACGVAGNYINTYIGRGKIILSGDYIDDELPQNRDFLKKQQAKKASKEVTAVQQQQSKEEPVLEDPDFSVLTAKKSGRKHIGSPKNHSGTYDLEQQKLEVEIEKRKQEVEKLKTYNAKQIGELAPIALFAQLLKLHNQSILSMQETTIEQALIVFAGDNRLSDAAVADMRGKLKRLLNEGLDKAIANTDKSVESIVKEFSAKRGVGDHG